MPLLPRLSSLWRNLFRKTQAEQELKQEVDAYLEMLIEMKIEQGIHPAEARRQALIEMGGVEQVKERVREARMGHHLETLWRDVSHAARGLRKHALLSIVVVATLTLGIGISTGVFTYINAEFLRARVDRDFDSFVQIYSAYTRDPARPGRPGNTTLEDYLAFRDRAKSLRDVAAWAKFEAPLDQDDPSETRALLVTPNFFSLYNLERPMMGRLLQPEDCAAANPVVVLSERLWRNRFAADPRIVGKIAHFNGQPVTVVGVTPKFAGQIDRTRAWFPYTLGTYLKRGDNLLNSGEAWLMVEGRLNPGFSRQDAAAELRLLAGQQDRLHPGRVTTITVTDGSEIQAPAARGILIGVVALITGALTFLVLIVCANVTTLLLARAATRQQEIAVRLALGAGRMRLIRMLLTETFLLASLAGLASLYFAYQLPSALERWTHNELRDVDIGWSYAPDWRVFVYLTLVTLLAGAMAGLTPALQSLKVDLSNTLKGRHSLLGGAARGPRLRGLLIGGQVALSFVLLVGAGIFVRAYQQVSGVNPGFETRQALSGLLHMRSQSTEQRSWSGFRHDLAQRLEALPGVQSVAYAGLRPFHPGSRMFDVQVPGQAMRKVGMNWVSPNFFSTLGIPILSGRALRESDPPCPYGAKGVCPVVVSQKHAREFWPNENPLGKTLRDPRGTTFEVVGIARDTSMRRLGTPDDAMIYRLWDPNAGPNAYQLLARFSGDGAALARAVTANIREMAPEISVEARTVQSWMDEVIEELRKMRLLVALLVAIAVFLAVISIYGVVAFAISQRTKELGIRLALGAAKKDIYYAVLGSSVRPIALGLVIGLGMTLAATSALARVLQRAPFTLNVQDPTTYAMAAILLVAVTLAAMLGPARRATRVDPMLALREE